MLEKAFNDVYTKFKLHFYQNVFQRFATREATLTTVESFCMEGIMAMGEPTIAEFSRMMQISTPNAAYKIGSLVRRAMWRRSSPPRIGANTTSARPRSISNITTSATLTCTPWWSVWDRFPSRGCGQAGANADGHQRRADAGAGYGAENGRLSCRKPRRMAGFPLFFHDQNARRDEPGGRFGV